MPHTLYAFNINAAADRLIDQISAQSYDDGSVRVRMGADGLPYPSNVQVDLQSPRFTFTTTDLPAILAENSSTFAFTGLTLDADNVGEFHYQSILAGQQIRAGAAAHIKKSVNSGFVVPRTLTATRGGGPAALTCEVFALYDGTNDPVVIETGQSLPGTPSVSALHYLGPIDLNGTDYDEEIEGVTIDFGFRLDFDCTSEGWPKNAYVLDVLPTVTITTSSPTLFSTFGMTGAALTTSEIYFRKGTEGGDRLAKATAEHVKFTMYEGWIGATSVSISHGARAMPTVVVELTKSVAQNIWAVAIASAIT